MRRGLCDAARVQPPERLDPAACAVELLALQRVSYRVEAGLIGSDAIPALHDSAETLAAAGLTWLAFRDDHGLLAAAALSETAEEVDLERLVVAPRAFRRGLGRRLVTAVLAHARDRRVVVSTGRDNAPARALYASLGFAPTGEREVPPGLVLVSYGFPADRATSSTSNPSEFSR
ncbi:MAG: hypothetical protein QOJ30_1651 [Pseudonocardiales bacterium]|jgi:GNAT superfamily N-acetyltransferase|nr:hypothetical protein [Pseudonocardiales bacterium]